MGLLGIGALPILSIVMHLITNSFQTLYSGGEDDEEAPGPQNRPPPRDVFRLRQLQRARGGSSMQSGSTSGNSGAFSGDISGSSE